MSPDEALELIEQLEDDILYGVIDLYGDPDGYVQALEVAKAALEEKCGI